MPNTVSTKSHEGSDRQPNMIDIAPAHRQRELAILSNKSAKPTNDAEGEQNQLND